MYDEVDINSLQTGDLVLFSGKGFVSILIKILTLSKWSHCGIVIADDPRYPFPLLYESTANIGVHVIPLKKKIALYNGTVAIRRVIHPNYIKRLHLSLYRSKVKGTPFESDNLQMLASSRFFKFLRRDRCVKGLFCSEHVAECYQALGWMRSDVPSNWYSPRYFSKVKNFLHGVSLGQIQDIKKD